MVKQLTKIRFIKVSGLNEREILKSYQNRDKSPVYELEVSSWKELANLDDNNVNEKIRESNTYDATLVSIFLKEPKYNVITYSDLKHLLSLIYNLRMSDSEKEIDGRKVFVCFRQECNGSQRDYFKLSAFLKLWAVQNDMFDNIVFYDETNKNPKHLAANFDSHSVKKWYTSYVSGSSFPFISINEQVCQILDRDYLLLKQSHKEKMASILSELNLDERNSSSTVKFINSYLYAYIEKSLEGVSQEDWQNFINKYKPSLLVVALFATIVNRMIDKKNRNRFLSERKCIALIERCYSYAQGILQLVENANEHVVEKKIGNSAFLGFWVRNDKTNFLQSNTDKTLDECEYFLEMFVIDCDFSDNVGIMSQYNQTLEDNNVQSKVESLKEVFDFPVTESKALKEYYRDTNHIAFHYGLQIFSGVISSSNGFLEVVSGNACYGSENLLGITFCNDNKNYIKKKPEEFHSQEKEIQNFSGTSYVILLPTILTEKEDNCYNFFLGNVPIGVKLEEELKICTITPSQETDFLTSDVLANSYNDEQILNIDLKNIIERKQIELACKMLLVKLVQNPSMKTLCLTGFKNEYSLLDAVRVISLFYNKLGEFKEIKKKGIFLYCRYNQGQSEKDKEYELYFNGSSLRSVKANIYRQKLVKDVPDLFLDELEQFLYNDSRGNNDVAKIEEEEIHNVEEQDEEPLSAAIIKYYLRLNGGNETIIQKQIKDILSTDIHEKPLGCKISNTHVRIGKVHLDTFYEAQFLFGNAYCTDIFALYVADRVKKQIELKKYDKIILYGYESYSTLTLYKAQNFLDNTSIDNEMPKSRMLVYETVNKRVRYLKKDLFKGNTLVVYVMGISSTLSTFSQMNDAFVKACKIENVDLQSKIDNMCLSIIQINGKGCEKFISFTNESHFPACKSNVNYINFALEKQAHCFVTAESKWYAAEQEVCQLCLPEQAQEPKTMFDEYPLIEVDDTSVVPTQMIFLNNANKTKNNSETVIIDDSCGKENTDNFLKNEDNSEYLRYGHIERCDNHFQYFFRIAELYHDKQNLSNNVKEIGIEDWLIKLKEKYAKAFDTDDKSVNILIAPQHFSNTGYVNSVAKCVFGDTAHIIELDIRKEYRSNFRTKYSNYRELSKYMDLNKNDNQYKLNFYYVNDQIITGRTFKRAESLINTLLGKKGKSLYGKTFKGVFTIVDRNSYETRKAYVEPINDGDVEYLPFFSYLRFDVPSLRNHDNSCPLCDQNNFAKRIVDSSAFNSSVHYWQKKIVYHKQRTSDEMRALNNKLKNDLENYRITKKRNFRRLQCENEIWQEISKSNDADITFCNILYVILNRKKQLILNDNINKGKRRKQKLEKALDTVNVMLDKIKDALERLEKDSCLSDNEAGRHSIDRKKILNNVICELRNFNIVYEFPINVLENLFKITIARLCAVGSCALLNKKRLYSCCVIGNYLEQESKKSHNSGIVPKGTELPSESYQREGCETLFGEYLISYLKVISRPLLFYREPVKKAALKLLLLFFDKLLKLEDDISVENIIKDDKLNDVETDEYYDETFNGFLLNGLKRLLCYDKSLSKCNYCDNYALKDSNGAFDFNGKFSGFFKRLYIENNHAARMEITSECGENWKIFDPNKISEYDDKGEIKLKYKYISDQLINYCCKQDSETKIAFFTSSEGKNDINDKKTEKEKYTSIGWEKEIKAPQIYKFNDFYYNGGIYYTRIGNNFNRLNERRDDQKDCKFRKDVYDSCQELDLLQDANVIVGVKTNDISKLRKIIAFRKEILREVEKDFNNGTVRRAIFFQIMTETLVRPEASSHNAAAHEAYHKAFANSITQDTPSSLEAQYNIISAYSSLIISEYYRHLVKRSIINNKDVTYTIEQEGNKNKIHIKFDIKKIERKYRADNERDFDNVSPYIDYLLKMLQHHVYPSLNLDIRYGDKENYEVLELGVGANKFEEFFKDYKIQNLFSYNKQHFYIFMILDILIKNVETHCPEKIRGKDFKVIVKFSKNDKGNIDLIVENKYNKKWDEDYKGSGITLYALANLFGTIDSASDYDDPEATLFYTGLDGNKVQEDEYNFVARLNNFIIKQI